MTNKPNINPNRAKIIEAIIYFSKNLKNPTKMMIYKVLAELDYRHFQETGMSVTNLDFYAWRKGPVPADFDSEISDRENKAIDVPDDFKTSLYVDEIVWANNKGKTLLWKAKKKPNLDIFTQRQKDILDNVAFIYKDSTATQASDASHEKDTPWEKTNKLYGEEGHFIDFLKILPKESRIDEEEIKERIEEIFAFTHNFKA